MKVSYNEGGTGSLFLFRYDPFNSYSDLGDGGCTFLQQIGGWVGGGLILRLHMG